MQTAITPLQGTEWEALQQQADMLVRSGFLPSTVKTSQQAIAIVMLGRELGIPPWASLNTINVIQGKPTVSPQLMLALINRSGQLEDLQVKDDGQECAVTMKRKGRTPHRVTFSMQDAAAMGLAKKDNWLKQPAIMRQWRAVAACARVAFADVILGLYTPEEMGADVMVDVDGNMEIIDIKPDPKGTATRPSTPTVKVDAFASSFPASKTVVKEQLYDAVHDFFDHRAHFDKHWDKHQAYYELVTQEEAERYVRDLHWNYAKERVEDLFSFGYDALGMDTQDILTALSVANGHSVKRARDWDGGTFRQAQAALLAAIVAYDPDGLVRLGIDGNFSADLLDAAEDVIEAVQGQQAERSGQS